MPDQPTTTPTPADPRDADRRALAHALAAPAHESWSMLLARVGAARTERERLAAALERALRRAARLAQLRTSEAAAQLDHTQAAAGDDAQANPHWKSLPWAAWLDDGDLSDLLTEIFHATLCPWGPAADPHQALRDVEKALATYRLIANADHAQAQATATDEEPSR